MSTKKPKSAGRNDGHETDYSEITENIYIGSNLCEGNVCPIHGAEFKKLEIGVEINLDNERKEIPPDDIEGYLWMPVVDGHSPSKVQMEMGVSIMQNAISGGKKVYIHCKNGHGRSPTLVAAYLVRHKNMTPEEAEKFISDRRSEIHIEDRQMAALRKFEQNGRSNSSDTNK